MHSMPLCLLKLLTGHSELTRAILVVLGAVYSMLGIQV